MKESLNKLEKCLVELKNPVLKYLDSGTPFDQKAFENALDLLQLEPHEDLISLYNWKHGIKKELVYSCDFNFKAFELGDPIDYTLAIESYQFLALHDKETYENRFFPFIMEPGFGLESPTFIDLSKKSKTYGLIFYYAPALLIPDPTSVYDSLYSMIETTITCYQQGVYWITDEGTLDYDSDKLGKIGGRMNRRSDLWKELYDNDWEGY